MSADLSTLGDQVTDLATQLAKQSSTVNASVQRVGVKTNSRGWSRERGSSNVSLIQRSYSEVAGSARWECGNRKEVPYSKLQETQYVHNRKLFKI